MAAATARSLLHWHPLFHHCHPLHHHSLLHRHPLHANRAASATKRGITRLYGWQCWKGRPWVVLSYRQRGGATTQRPRRGVFPPRVWLRTVGGSDADGAMTADGDSDGDGDGDSNSGLAPACISGAGGGSGGIARGTDQGSTGRREAGREDGSGGGGGSGSDGPGRTGGGTIGRHAAVVTKPGGADTAPGTVASHPLAPRSGGFGFSRHSAPSPTAEPVAPDATEDTTEDEDSDWDGDGAAAKATPGVVDDVGRQRVVVRVVDVLRTKVVALQLAVEAAIAVLRVQGIVRREV